jgi:hypothetical protein
MKEEWAEASRECEDLIDRLTAVDPLVIDYFLGQNQHLGDIGRFCIAWVLLEREAVFLPPSGWNVNRRGQTTPFPPDNWCRFLVHKLVTGCRDGESLLDNKVTFITFNYDVSLEFQLFKGLKKLAQFSTPDDLLARFFERNRFLHIYGKIRENPLTDPPALDFSLFDRSPPQPGSPAQWTAVKTLFDAIYDASNPIHTIAPYEKSLTPTRSQKLRSLRSQRPAAYTYQGMALILLTVDY